MRSLISRSTSLFAALLLLSACSAGPAQPGTDESPRRIDLTMTDELTFEPATIQVRRGETIQFVVRNASDQGHEAFLGTEEEQGIHAIDHSGFGNDQANTPHTGNGVHVAPFGNGGLTYRFDQPGDRAIGCHYPGHYKAGMRAVIEVSD